MKRFDAIPYTKVKFLGAGKVCFTGENGVTYLRFMTQQEQLIVSALQAYAAWIFACGAIFGWFASFYL